MKILIACYPRVGNRYFLKSLQQASKEHWSFATHDRNLTHLYHDKYQMIQNDLLIHLVANPYDSVMSFINAFGPVSQEEEILNFKVPAHEVNPWPLEYIDSCSNNFAVSNHQRMNAIFTPAFRQGDKSIEINDYQKHNFIELMLRCDFFQYEEHFDRVINNDLPLRMITIKYESLSSEHNLRQIKDFLGPQFETLAFPTYKLRKSIWKDSPYADYIEKVYASLYNKYMDLPDVKVWR